MAKAKKPNILVIWGDDIGISNLSCYSHGLMGYQTPNIDRIAKEGMMFTDSLRRAVLHRGPLVLHHRPERLSHRPVKGRHSRRADRHEREDRHDSGAAEEPGLRHRPVRQEPSRRSQPACCRPITASTSSSAISTISMPRKSRRCTTTSHGKGLPDFIEEVRSARRHPILGDRQGRSDGAAALGQGRQAEDQGYRPAHQEAHGDLRRRFRRQAAKDFIKRQNDDGKPFFVWLNTTHMHLFTHTKQESLGQAGRWQSPYHDTMIDHDKNVGEMLDYLDELGIADDTFVHVLDRQRPAQEFLAGRRHDAVPQREEHQLGRRVPHSVAGALARARSSRASISNEIVQHHDWLPTFLAMAGEPDVVEKLKKGYRRRSAAPTRTTSTASTCCPT